MLLSNARIVTPDVIVEGWLEVRDGVIAGFGPGPSPHAEVGRDLAGSWLTPGFVDIHAHGGGGASFQAGDPDEVATAARFHRRHGTTTMLASLVSAALPDLVRSVRRLADLVADRVVAGIHLEGPFLAEARCGAHDPRLLRDPLARDVDALLAAGEGRVVMVTLAPELDGGLDAVRRIDGAGAIAAIGHTTASYERTVEAIEAGAGVATHLFNAMPPLHHRSPGPVLALLEDERVVVELVNDGFHVHPDLVRHVLSTVGAVRTALVSDAIAMAGLGDGRARLGGLEVVVRDGQARLADGDSLAGSVLTLDQAVRNAVAAGVALPEAVRAASTTPARTVGLDGRAGRIRVGAPADLVVLDDSLAVRDVLVAGRWEPRG